MEKGQHFYAGNKSIRYWVLLYSDIPYSISKVFFFKTILPQLIFTGRHSIHYSAIKISKLLIVLVQKLSDMELEKFSQSSHLVTSNTK